MPADSYFDAFPSSVFWSYMLQTLYDRRIGTFRRGGHSPTSSGTTRSVWASSDCLDTGLDKAVSNLRRLCLWNGQGRYLNLILLDVVFQIVHGADFNPRITRPIGLGLISNMPLMTNPPPFKIRIVCNGLPQITSSMIIRLCCWSILKSLLSPAYQVLDIITVTLLAESSKLLKV